MVSSFRFFFFFNLPRRAGFVFLCRARVLSLALEKWVICEDNFGVIWTARRLGEMNCMMSLGIIIFFSFLILFLLHHRIFGRWEGGGGW